MSITGRVWWGKCDGNSRVSVLQLSGRWYRGCCQCHWGLWAADWQSLQTSSYDENWCPAGWTTPSEQPPDSPGNKQRDKEDHNITSSYPHIVLSSLSYHHIVFSLHDPTILSKHRPTFLTLVSLCWLTVLCASSSFSCSLQRFLFSTSWLLWS